MHVLLDTIPIQVWYLTDERTYGPVNKTHATFMGRSASNMEDRDLYDLYDLYDLLPTAVADVCMRTNRQAFGGNSAITSEEWVANASGKFRLLSITKTPWVNDSSSTENVFFSAINITEQRQTR